MMVDHTDAGDKTAAEGAEVLHYVRDALGSVVGLVDAGDPDATPEPIPAKLVERYDYDPYGKTYVEYWDATAVGGAGAWVRTADAASHFGNPFMWTSQRYDQTVGLYHFPFRSYSPELGRWMQRDPLGYVDGVSLYQYVGSHPTMLGDPLGLAPHGGPDEGRNQYENAREGVYERKQKAERKLDEAWWAWDRIVKQQMYLGRTLEEAMAYATLVVADAGRGFAYRKAMAMMEHGDSKGDKNALRHVTWSAYLAFHYGEPAAIAVLSAHEHGNPPNADTMADWYNNMIGLYLAALAKQEGWSIDRLMDEILNWYKAGRFITDRRSDWRIPAMRNTFANRQFRLWVRQFLKDMEEILREHWKRTEDILWGHDHMPSPCAQ